MKSKMFLFVPSVLFSFAILVVSLACTQPFSLKELVDGPDAKILAVSPSSGQIQINESLTINASGGIPPYSYTIISGDGSLYGNIYTASIIPGTVKIKITDHSGSVRETILTVLAKDFSISPQSMTVFINQSMNFSAVGGYGGFSFAMSGSSGGMITPIGAYTAGSIPGTDIITITDTYDSRIRTSTITVVDIQSNVDYETFLVGGIVLTEPLAGSSFNAEFSFRNIGSAAGSKPINWIVYASADTIIGGLDDRIVATETLAGRPAGSTTAVPFSGNWPSVAGAYYLLVEVSAADDLTPGNNQNQSPLTTQIYNALSVSPMTSVIYTGQPVTFTASGGTGSHQYAFTQNQSGAAAVTADVYTAGRFAGTDIISVVDTAYPALPAATATITVQAKILSISPQSTTVFINQSMNFSAVGGDGGFSFAMSGSSGGMITPIGAYTAGSMPGTDIITMTDAYDNRIRTATVTVVDIQSNVDYETFSVGGIVLTEPLGGSSFNAEFSIRNIGSAAGSKSINWIVYTSTDTIIGGLGDSIVASGTLAGRPAGSTIVVPFSGNWPSEADTYYILVDVNAADDLTSGNNQNQSPLTTQIYKALSISPMAIGIYTGKSVAFAVSGGTGSHQYAFTQNQSGAAAVTADVYTAGLVAGTDIISVVDTAYPAWPAAIATITIATLPATPPGLINDVDYYVLTPPAGGASAALGDPVSASFSITNQGSDNGLATVYWTAYISSDAVFNAGDNPVDSGSLTPLAAGGVSGMISIDSGTWSNAGNWYLLVRLQAADELNTANNIRPSSNVYAVTDVLAAEPDYKPSAVSMYTPYVTTGSSIQEKFSLANIGSNGTQNVIWTAYVSLNSLPDPGEEVGIGTVGPLGGGLTQLGISLLGANWPAVLGDYYLIVSVTAADEINTGDFTVSAGRFTISSPPDYVIQSPGYPVSAQAGSPISGGFSIKNIGSGDGKKNIRWEAFLSFDSGFSDDDLVLGAGEIAPLAAGGSVAIQVSDLGIGTWPPYGLCYVLVRLNADDDGIATNNTYRSSLVELYILDAEGPILNGTANDGYGPSIGPIANTQYLGLLKFGQTLVIKGWLDSKIPITGRWDTYSFVMDTGVSSVSTYVSWVANVDIGQLHIWDEANFEKISMNNASYREPSTDYLSVFNWVAPKTVYVGIQSNLTTLLVGDEYPYTLCILGRN